MRTPGRHRSSLSAILLLCLAVLSHHTARLAKPAAQPFNSHPSAEKVAAQAPAQKDKRPQASRRNLRADVPGHPSFSWSAVTALWVQDSARTSEASPRFSSADVSADATPQRRIYVLRL